jgi:hypothetical protein
MAGDDARRVRPDLHRCRLIEEIAMGHAQFSWTSIDRAHERQGEADDDFDARLAEGTKRQIAAIRTNALTGHVQTLEQLAEGLAHRMSGKNVTEYLVRAALVGGPLTAGQMLLDLITKCIADDAENAALVELERADLAGGLDWAAIRATTPDLQVPA